MKTVQPWSLFLEQWGVSSPRRTNDNPADSELKAALSARPVWPSMLFLFSLMVMRWLGPVTGVYLQGGQVTLQVDLSEKKFYFHINSTPTIQTAGYGRRYAIWEYKIEPVDGTY